MRSDCINRRQVLKLVGAVGATLALPAFGTGCGHSPSSPGVFIDTSGLLPIPPLLDGELVDGVRVFRLTMQTGSMTWVPDTNTPTFGINGDYLGPTMHFRRGERVRIEVTNALDEASTLHWHGIELPAQSDGGPYQSIAPGETKSSSFDVVQRSITAWYHPHQMHETGRQVHMGMAGLIKLEDEKDSFELPSTYGVDDIPIVIQDRRFASDGSHPYSSGDALGMFDIMAGLKGGTILVNGAVLPTHLAPQGLVRFRILNGSNARNYNLGFSDDRSFLHIANEGGLFEAPVNATRVLLAPAERAEILVDFGDDPAASTILLQSFSGEVRPQLFAGNMGANLSDALDASSFDIMNFEVGDPPATAFVAPKVFAAIENLSQADVARERSITLSMGMGSVFINDSRMLDMESVADAINFRVPVGETEMWVVKNTSGMAHPLHLHNRHFQILDIDGAAPPAQLSGFKDTVLVLPNQTVRLLVPFDGTADAEFPYMFHCHILEHEDAGMMGQFYLV